MNREVDPEFACDCLDCEDSESPCTGDCGECIGCIEYEQDRAQEIADGRAAQGYRGGGFHL